MMKLGVFDSGIGGEAVARSLALHFPEAIITTVNDRAHVPYGDREADEIQRLTDTAIQPLLGSDIIVIACICFLIIKRNKKKIKKQQMFCP